MPYDPNPTNEMQNLTPSGYSAKPNYQRVPSRDAALVRANARDTTLLQAAPATRADFIHLRYDGRKMPSGRTRAVPGEHMDIIVPDDADNQDAVEDFLYTVRSAPGVSPHEQEHLGVLNHKTMHLAGRHYHFEGGELTPVENKDVDWLFAHKVYAFSQV